MRARELENHLVQAAPKQSGSVLAGSCSWALGPPVNYEKSVLLACALAAAKN
jgi:hypothetical protein